MSIWPKSEVNQHQYHIDLKQGDQYNGPSPMSISSLFPDPKESCQMINDIPIRIQELKNIIDQLELKRNDIFSHFENINFLNSNLHDLINSQKIKGLAHQRLQDAPNDAVLLKIQKEKERITNQLNGIKAALNYKQQEWIERSKYLFDTTGAIQRCVLDEHLANYKRCQQLAGNGSTFENNLDAIQVWCESLTAIWLNLRSQLDLMSKYSPPNVDYMSIRKNVDNMIGILVKKTFIVEKQPPQVLKTNTRFPSTVRSLIGGQLNVPQYRPQVKASILSESQARFVMQTKDDYDFSPKDTSGAILNREAPMEYHPTTKQVTASFRTMTLKKITRTEKKGTESVMDEKFALLFQSVFKIAAGELVFYVKVLSLPVVVIVHGNQENHAWATVTWDNAFASPERAPFLVPDKVHWSLVGQVLSMKFKAAVGCELTAEDLRFLAGKAFRDFNLPEYDNLQLSWAQFSKEPLPDRNFTFWEWFYSILKLTREHLKDLWKPENRYVYGFISRKQTEDLLMERPDGTFLLRYSETEQGCITIAYKAEARTGDAKSVYMIKPFNQKDIQIRSLADRIHDLKHLRYLYPDIPKDQAFSRFYEPEQDVEITSEGYIPPVLVTHIPEWAVSGGDSYPNTPHSTANTNSPMNELYADPPSSVGSLSSDMRLNVDSLSSLQDVDLYNIINDVDYDMDDIPADLSGVGLNDLFANATNGFVEHQVDFD